MLTPQLAESLARVALANIEREHPRRIDHLLRTPGDELAPRKLHPAFFGSYDWHSAVHMHWTLARVLRLYPTAPIAADIARALDSHLSSDALDAELAYLKANPTFERPYGWAWLLKLQTEALAQKARWARTLATLAAQVAASMTAFVSGAPYPVRAGSHGNTAFACVLALEYARAVPDQALEFEIRKAARRWYADDCDAPLAYEPSLDDFLSPALVEAMLMAELMEPREFDAWRERFCPRGWGVLAEPPSGYDHDDPKHSHLDGLCLSRAWCFTRLGDASAAQANLHAGLRHVSGGDYAGEHWLASFAVLALTAASAAAPRTP